MRKIIILLFFLFPFILIAASGNLKPTKCVQIYYDHSPTPNDPAYYNGRLYAIALQNLVSHFPDIQQYIIPIELYQTGQLDRCEASFYLGTYYNNFIPQKFISDFLKTRKTVVWIGANVWKLSQENFKKLWSVSFIHLFKTNWEKKDSAGRPGIYNTFDYKGQTFERCKFNFPPHSQEFIAHYTYNYPITLLKPLNPAAEKNVISWAHFTLDKTRTPYILKQANHWYVADNPFLFICEGDRYFIFSDVLFDILHEKPQDGGKKYALIRYEDVSPNQKLINITAYSDLFNKLKIPFAISLIPIYVDSFHLYRFYPYMEMKERPTFIQALQYAKSKGASFIMHAVTHQYDHTKNPFSGVSGEDFEFWDKTNEMPLPEDSVSYILSWLTKGATLITKADFKISAWMTAHYLASALDNTIFGQVFTWNVTRGNYSVSKISHLNSLPEKLTYDRGIIDNKTNKERLARLSKLKVITYSATQIHQIFPYPIYGDYYGRRVIPEDLGNIQTFLSDQVIAKRTVDDIIKDAKRYSVLRDTWASFFLHDVLLNTTDHNGLALKEGDTSEIKRLINAIKEQGYEFVNLQQWTDTHQYIKRPPPIEIDNSSSPHTPFLAD
ncbi:MAG: hypothetical protein K0S27_1346 [Gammaproteobacteria bacterium]|jgi:uncharacterized protein YdaL|nr:hypothetical protein [Gammaproteobacteria bacterium]